MRLTDEEITNICIETHLKNERPFATNLEAFTAIARAIEAAVAERCAQICEEVVMHEAGYGGQWEGYGNVMAVRDGKQCAAAIRGQT